MNCDIPIGGRQLIPVWFVGGIAALLALGLSIFVGLTIVDMFDDPGSESFPPFPSLPIESSTAGPTSLPTLVGPTLPPVTPPPPTTPPPTPEVTPEPTSPLGSVRIEGGGALAGEHQVDVERSFIQGVSLITQVIFPLEGNQCTVVIVVDSESVSGTFDVDSQAKGTLACLNTGIDYAFFDGTVALQRELDGNGNDILSGQFSIMARNAAAEEITIESEFEDVPIEAP